MIKPTFKNQMCSFGTMVIYQLILLAPIGRFTQVNLNFALCHSPADPAFPYIGYHYFTCAVAVLNVFSFIGRYGLFIVLLPLKYLYKKKEVNENEIKGNKSRIVKR